MSNSHPQSISILPLQSKILKPGFTITKTLIECIRKNKITPKSGDILVITSKVLALSQKRMVNLAKIHPGPKAKKLARRHYHHDARLVQLILDEADSVFPGNLITTVKNGILIPSAGIDLSNAPEGTAILWPKNPWAAAEDFAKKLRKRFRIKNLGVIISDSRCTPLRWGTTGVALAWSGFEGIEDSRGIHDIFGKPLTVTRKAVADNLVSATLLIMGEAAERIPFAIIRGAPVHFNSRKVSWREVSVEPRECVFSGIYSQKFKNHANTAKTPSSRRSRIHPRH